MEILAKTPTIPTAPASEPAPKSAPPQAVERNLQGATGAADKAAQALEVAQTHVELAYDETINRVVGQVVDEETGEAILELPPKQLKALYTKMREQLGPLVDEKS